MPNFLRKSKQTLPVPWIGGQHVDDARAAYGEDGPYLATKRSSVNNSSLPPLYARFATTSGDRSDQTSDSSNERMYVPHHASSSSVQVDTSPPPPPSKDRRHSTQPHYTAHLARHISSVTASEPMQSLHNGGSSQQLTHEILRATPDKWAERSLHSPSISQSHGRTSFTTPDGRHTIPSSESTHGSRVVPASQAMTLRDAMPSVIPPLSTSFYGTHVVAAITPPIRSPPPPSPPPKLAVQNLSNRNWLDSSHGPLDSTPSNGSLHISRSQLHTPTTANIIPNVDNVIPEPVRHGPLIFPGGMGNTTRGANLTNGLPHRSTEPEEPFSSAVHDEWRTLVNSAFAHTPSRAGQRSDTSAYNHDRAGTERSSEHVEVTSGATPIVPVLANIANPAAVRHNTMNSSDFRQSPSLAPSYPTMRAGLPTLQTSLPVMRNGVPTMLQEVRSADKDRIIQPYEQKRSRKGSIGTFQVHQQSPSQHQGRSPSLVQNQRGHVNLISPNRREPAQPFQSQENAPKAKARSSAPPPPPKNRFSFLPWKSEVEPVKYATLQKRRQDSGGSISGSSGVNRRAKGLEPQEPQCREDDTESAVMPSQDRRRRAQGSSHASTPPLSGVVKGPRRMASRESFFAGGSLMGHGHNSSNSVVISESDFHSSMPPSRRAWLDDHAPKPEKYYGVEHSGPLGPYVNSENPRYFPLEDFMAVPELLVHVIAHMAYPTWCSLASTTKRIRLTLDDRALTEVVLERYLAGVGYSRWIWNDEPMILSLKDLGFYMQGVSMPTYLYAQRSRTFIFNRDEPSREGIRGLAFSTQAYSRVVMRIRAQFEAQADAPIIPFSNSESGTPRQNGMPHAQRQTPHLRTGHIMRSRNGNPPSTIFQLGRAASLRVFVPSPHSDEQWLSDASILQCEAQLKRAGLSKLLRHGDVVWDVALGEEGNVGKLIWDGSYLIDLDFTYSPWGDVPHYFHSLAYPPAYFHRIIRTGGNGTVPNPVVNIDISPWHDQIISNIQLVQDRAPINTNTGAMHNVMQWVHRTSFVLRPAVIQTLGSSRELAGMRIPIHGTDLFVDPNWHGTVVIETGGTNESVDELRKRCSMSGADRVPALLVYRLLRERSRPGELWLRTVTQKDHLM